MKFLRFFEGPQKFDSHGGFSIRWPYEDLMFFTFLHLLYYQNPGGWIGGPWGPFWGPFGTIWSPFGVHFGTIIGWHRWREALFKRWTLCCGAGGKMGGGSGGRGWLRCSGSEAGGFINLASHRGSIDKRQIINFQLFQNFNPRWAFIDKRPIGTFYEIP